MLRSIGASCLPFSIRSKPGRLISRHRFSRGFQTGKGTSHPGANPVFEKWSFFESQRRVLRNSEQEPVVAEQSPKKGECDDFFERLCFGGVAAKLKKPLATLTLARFASVSVTSIRCGMRKMQIWVFANEMTICKNEFRNTLQRDSATKPRVGRNELPWATDRKDK